MRTDPNLQHWFDLAERDLERAHRRYAETDFVDCLFHLQQCAEKAMKGRLISAGWPLQKTQPGRAEHSGSLLMALIALGLKKPQTCLPPSTLLTAIPDLTINRPMLPSCGSSSATPAAIFELSGRGYTGPNLPSG